MHGDLTYVELALIHEPETLAFYQDLCGWTFTDSFISKQRYILFQTPGKKQSGGFDASLRPSENGAQIYIECHDLNQTLLTIKQKHKLAKILKEKTLISLDYGYYALVLDPSGNLIGFQEYTKAHL